MDNGVNKQTKIPTYVGIPNCRTEHTRNRQKYLLVQGEGGDFTNTFYNGSRQFNGTGVMKCIELKVYVNVPDDYEYASPLDVLIDENYREDMEITGAEVLDEYDWQ